MSSIEPSVPLPAAGPEKGTERARAVRFGATLALVLGGLSAWVIHRGGSTGTVRALLGVAVVLPLYSLAHPRGALALRSAWLRIGGAIGRVNSAIVLSVAYFLILTPLGVGRRLFWRERRTGASSFERAPERDSRHFEHPY